MEQRDLSKLGDDKQTVQKQTAPLALQLVSYIAALYYVRIVGITGQRKCSSNKYSVLSPANTGIYSLFELHQPPCGHQNQLV